MTRSTGDPAGGTASDLAAEPVGREFAERIVRAVQQGVVVLPGIAASANLEVSRLGAGETYAAWRLSSGQASFTLRVVNRPDDEMPRPMPQEFEALRLVPDAVGTQAVSMNDDPENPLGRPWMLTTFMPSRVKAASEWRANDLARTAQVLARLHRERAPRCGPVTDPRGSRIDIVDDFAAAWAWWQNSAPELTSEPGIRALHGAIAAHFAREAGAFAALDRFALIHGDLVATNVVFHSDSSGEATHYGAGGDCDVGEPRFIDWEWSEFGDPAKDLAFLGGEVHGGPWTVPITDAEVDAFIEAYVQAAAELGGEEDRALLRRRRDCWELHERFLSSLHYAAQARKPGPDPVYAPAVESIHATLEQRLEHLART